VLDRLRAARPQAGAGTNRETKLGLVRAQTRLKRGHLPLRRLLERAGDAIQAITPCFLMSPISVAHYLAPGAATFDVVIFDEASQIEPADAYGAIARARQAVLLGDEKQLPPTTFFTKVEQDAVAADAAGGVAPGDLESILGVGIVRLPATHRCGLRWHYRSRDPSLIDFSNRSFYDRSLTTFPGPRSERTDLGVFLRPVPGSGYRRGAGQFNPEEARAVAEAVMAHARAWARAGAGPSLGVGAFSVAQQRAIEDEVERFRREDAGGAAEAFFDPGRDEPFFVKNLETIQGDERDVVMLSVGYGRDAAGRLTMNFGPLNLDNGWRRLNVLVTRSRLRCEVFSTLAASDLRVEDGAPRGVAALRDYLAFAERGRFDDVPAPSARDHASAFEAEVARGLRARGHDVHVEVGVPPWFVDLAVVDPARPGTYLLGIECDGTAYRAGATARDRERLRREVLERMGWRIERVWSADWFRRERAVLDRLEARIARERERAAGTASPAGAAPPAAPAGSASSQGQPRVSEAAPATTLPAGVEPYPARPTRTLGDVEALLRASPARMGEWVGEIVLREAPIHVEEALRALVARFGARASARPREAFERALPAILASGRAVRRGDFLWTIGMRAPPVRFRGGDCPVTDPDLVCPEEFEEAVRGTAVHEFGGTKEGLISATVRRLGWTREGAKIRAGVERAFDSLVERGDLTPDGGGQWVAKREG
jgi:very-short-patch-repair endonuclease